MRTGEAAPFIAAALAGLAAHPSESTRTPEETAARAVALGFAVAKHIGGSDDDDEPDSERGPLRGETINLRVDDTIARAMSDLVERVGALEAELADITAPASPAPTKPEPHAKVK